MSPKEMHYQEQVTRQKISKADQVIRDVKYAVSKMNFNNTAKPKKEKKEAKDTSEEKETKIEKGTKTVESEGKSESKATETIAANDTQKNPVPEAPKDQQKAQSLNQVALEEKLRSEITSEIKI